MNIPISDVWVVGCGGVGSYLVPVLLKLLNASDTPPAVVLCDQDTVELKNLDRQLFSEEDIGENKAALLVEKYRHHYKGSLTAAGAWFTPGTTIPAGCLVITCVDNHPARRAILDQVDAVMGSAILCANEYTDASAEYYEPAWKNTPLDPRVRWPVILTDNSDDPTRREGCTGAHVLTVTPQLAAANFAAANFGLQLLWFHFVERLTWGRETMRNWPVEHRSNVARSTTTLVKHLLTVPATPPVVSIETPVAEESEVGDLSSSAAYVK